MPLNSANQRFIAAVVRTRLIHTCAAVLMLGTPITPARSDRIDLFPRLQAGQTITYRIAYHVQKQTKTQSSISWAQTPADADIDVQGLLRMEVLGVKAQGRRSAISARTWFESFNLDAQTPAQSSPQATNPKASEDSRGIAVEFTVSPSGRIDQVNGLDALSPDQQQGWQQWATTFAAAAAFPADGIKLAQKWKSEEPEKSPSPIAGLTWTRESTYLRNEPCHAAQLTIQGDVADSSHASETESCAVIQTTAALKQKSSSKNATPEDFKLHQLRTTGAAGGTNKTLLYISLTTGLVIRSSDQADQTMNVIVTKTDGSNHVRYDIHARSNTEIFQIANSEPNNP
jgi:hypothetical protein